MNLFDLLPEACVARDAAPKEPEGVLRALAHLAKQSPALEDIEEETICSGLREREALGTTGFGDGVAIPHCRLPGVAIGLALIVRQEFGALAGAHAAHIGATLITAVTATCIVFEIVGPILTKVGLERAGEAGADPDGGVEG